MNHHDPNWPPAVPVRDLTAPDQGTSPNRAPVRSSQKQPAVAAQFLGVEAHVRQKQGKHAWERQHQANLSIEVIAEQDGTTPEYIRACINVYLFCRDHCITLMENGMAVNHARGLTFETNISDSALVELAHPRTPKIVQDHFLKMLEGGLKVVRDDVRQLTRRFTE